MSSYIGTPKLLIRRSVKLLKELSVRGRLKNPKASIFWDFENCHIPKRMNAREVVFKLKNLASNDGLHLAGIIAIGNVKKLGTFAEQELKESGVQIQNINCRKESAADIAIMVEIFKMVIDSGVGPIYLISGDGDFSKLIELLESIGSRVTLIHNHKASASLRNSPTRSLFWEDFLISKVAHKLSKSVSGDLRLCCNDISDLEKLIYLPSYKVILNRDLVKYKSLINYFKSNGNAPTSLSVLGSHPNIKGIHKIFGYTSLSKFIRDGVNSKVLRQTSKGKLVHLRVHRTN
jgi:uncharacterized LabA/DUF88 family protein